MFGKFVAIFISKVFIKLWPMGHLKPELSQQLVLMVDVNSIANVLNCGVAAARRSVTASKVYNQPAYMTE